MSNENINNLLKSAPIESFSQWSADNIDHNVKTIDGKGSLHAMGIIVSTTGGNFSEMKRGLPSVNEALFYTGVTTLFRDPRGGLSLVPLITF